MGHGKTHSIWESIDGGLSPLSTEQQGQIDWSMYVPLLLNLCFLFDAGVQVGVGCTIFNALTFFLLVNVFLTKLIVT